MRKSIPKHPPIVPTKSGVSSSKISVAIVVVILAGVSLSSATLVSEVAEMNYFLKTRELMEEKNCMLSAALRAAKSGNHEKGTVEVLQCEKVAIVTK